MLSPKETQSSYNRQGYSVNYYCVNLFKNTENIGQVECYCGANNKVKYIRLFSIEHK